MSESHKRGFLVAEGHEDKPQGRQAWGLVGYRCWDVDGL